MFVVGLAAANAGAAFAQGIPATPRLTRSLLEDLERATDRKLETVMDEDPFSLLGNTRGVYLERYGVVFTAEVELAPSAAQNPFRPAYGKGELVLLKEKKKHRVGQLKESMRAMLYQFANSRLALRPEDMIALAITIPYFSWENAEGMPRQIVMTAAKKTLMEARSGNAAAVSSIRIEEVY